MMRNRLRPTGFNFTEVLFAVMILALGFIMCAAIFPVALMQTKQTQEETAAAGTARGGANYLEQFATDAVMPATGVPNRGVKPTTDAWEGDEVRVLDLRAEVRGSLLLAADQRYAWIPFYRRTGSRDPTRTNGSRDPGPAGAWSDVAQVYMVPVAVRNRSQFDKGVPATVQGVRADAPAATPPAFAATGVPLLVASIVDATAPGTANPDDVDFIEFDNVSANNTDGRFTAVAEGAYVIVAGAPVTPAASPLADPTGAHARIGHIFRVGNPTATQPDDIASNNPGGYPRRWELIPGNDYVPLPLDTDEDGDIDITPLTLPAVSVFVAGRSLADPSKPYKPNTDAAPNEYEGNTQDVAAYTTFVNIR